jgi:hypothetical protein
MDEFDHRLLARGELVSAAWAEIVECLEGRKRRLYEEIRSYPTPIAGCDQQFNYLLEQQAGVSAELTQVREALTRIEREGASTALVEFVTSSQGIDDALKQRIRVALGNV